MTTPTTGTIPALPQYGTGGLAIASTVSIEIVDTAVATAAGSYRMLQSDFVGKAPGILLPGTPVASDVVSFLQVSSNLPFACTIGNLGIPSGNLPTGGATGTILSKASLTNFNATWIGISTLLSAGTGITISGSTTAGIGITNFGVTSSQIATNAVGNIQLRQGAALSVIGNATGSIANVADISASGGNQFLQSNAAGTGLLFTTLTISTSALPVLFSTPYTSFGALYAGGATTLSGTNFGTTGMFLMGNGSAVAPGFALVNLGNSTSVTGTTTFANGGTGTTTLATPWGVVVGGTTALGVTAAGTSGFVLAGTGTTSAPTFQNITTLAVTLVTAGGGLTVSVGSTGGSITGTGTLSLSETPLVKTALYTSLTTDLGQLVAFSTAALATFVLATTNATSFGAGWFTDVVNFGGTTLVLAPLGAAVFTGVGATTFLGPRQSVRVISDGTNYQTWAHQGLQLSRVNTAQSFTGGMRLVPFNAGTTSGGTVITFDSGNGPIQYVRNVGTGTFSTMAVDGEIDCLVMASTNASTITFVGFNASTSAPTGDTVTWNATAIYLLSMRRVNGSSTYRWAAYQ